MEAIRVMPSEIEELHVQLRRICSTLTEIKEDMKEVKAQVRETNGRVSKLELWKARADGARAALTSSWAGVLAVGGIAVAIISVVLAET